LNLAPTHEWLGVKYDYTKKTVCLTDRFLAKTAGLLETIDSWSFRELQQAMSYAFYASCVLQIDMSAYYHVIKFYARRCKEASRDPRRSEENTRVWKSVRHLIYEWLECISANTPVIPKRPQADQAPWLLFTDSSTDGWGAILVNNATKQVWSSGGKWKECARLHINQKEVLAVRNGLAAFQDQLQGQQVHLFIDNIAARATLRRGYGKSFGLNLALRRVLQRSTVMNIQWSDITYVASALNPADGPSRGLPVDHASMQHVFQQLASASLKGVKGDQSGTPSRPRRGGYVSSRHPTPYLCTPRTAAR
jgi:hypothetical protein